MQIRIKKFEIDMQVRQKGIEFEVRQPDGTFVGDCYVTMTGLTWCAGKTTRVNGVKVKWSELEEILYSDATRKAALAAARQVP